ncbi:MAG: hypothetical protein ACXW2E_12840 [Nitrososphaeraceae archaeon]
MSNFNIAVEAKDETKKKEPNSEEDAFNTVFIKQEGSKFENCALPNLKPFEDYLSDGFKNQLMEIVNSQPDPETGKRKNFLYNGYRYGVSYKKDLQMFQVWRMKQDSTSGGGGSGQYQKKTILYDLQKIFEGGVYEANKELEDFNAKKTQYQNMSLVNVFQGKDGKLVYVLKQDNVRILGQDQPTQPATTTEGAKKE